MPSLSHPKALYFSRIAQLLFAIGFLVIISWSGVHRGWWRSINGSLAVGGTFPSPIPNFPFSFSVNHQLRHVPHTVIATIFTLAVTLHTIITSHLKRNPFSSPSTFATITRLAVEVLVFLLWIASVTLMLRPKGGCDRDEGQFGKFNDRDACFPQGGENHEGDHFWTDENPGWRWNLGVAFGFVEM